MLQKYKSKMAAAAILSFAESGLFGYSNPCMANIYQCTKFDENIFIYDWDMAKNRKFKMAVAAMLNFAIRYLPTVTIVWPIFQCTKIDHNTLNTQTAIWLL